MRHTARKVKRALLARKPRTAIAFKTLRTKVGRMSAISLVKRNPYPSLGIALGLSAISGLAVWIMNRK